MSGAPLPSSIGDEAGATRRPVVSIVMATYNCRGTVEEAVQSIICQSFEDWEAVICDDASTDGTHEWLKDIARRDSRFVVLRNQENRRLAFSLNRCLVTARGSLIARMDGDDVSEPDRLRRQVEFLSEHAEVHLVGTAMQRFDGQGPGDIVRPPSHPDRNSLRYGVPFCHATVMARKHVFDALGGYTVSKRTERGQDYDLWFRFFHSGFTGRNLDEPLYLVREDIRAIRRRTVMSRIHTYQTTLMGYSMLGYPLTWYLRPTLGLLKGLVPARMYSFYRKLQRRRFLRARLEGE